MGIELVDNADGSVTMCQRRYVDDILKRFGTDNCKAMMSPTDMISRLVASNAASKVDAPLRESVGAVMLLMNVTRPDVAFAVGYISCFMENPQAKHWIAVKRILHYLQVTKSHDLCFKAGNKVDFCGYSDADWAGDHADRKSSSGYAFVLSSVVYQDDKEFVEAWPSEAYRYQYHHIRDEAKREVSLNTVRLQLC